MKKQTFILKNHNKEEKNIVVEVSLEIKQKRVNIEYRVTGEIDNYIFETFMESEALMRLKSSSPIRANNLWKSTCFELFIAPKENLNYWELNISSSTKWNFYAFDSYKENMREERDISIPNIEIVQKENLYFISCEFNLREIIPKQSNFNLAVILLDRNCVRHFYSINRKGGVVDFHDKKYWNSF